MIQFNMQRFLKLARWSFTMDRQWFVKTILRWLVVMTLMFLFFTCVMDNQKDSESFAYYACTSIIVLFAIGISVMGASMMFNSMKGKYDDQRLLMLPASNLEKYVMRYCYWLLLIPCCLLAFVVADAVQYGINVLLGHERVMLVMECLKGGVDETYRETQGFRVSLLLLLVWLHSFYAVGATFCRSHKYNWIATSVVLIIGYMLLLALAGGWPNVNIAFLNYRAYFHFCFIVLTVLNFWLSYRFFCRQQAIGKFVNL